MAAVDPSESPKRQKTPTEEVETCSGKSEAAETASSSDQKHETTRNQTAERPDDEQGARVGNEGGCVASHSEVSVESESGAGAEKTTCDSPEDPATAGEMAEAQGDERRRLDLSETEGGDVEEAKTHAEEINPHKVAESSGGVQQDTHVDDNIAIDAEQPGEEETSHPDATSAEKRAVEQPVTGDHRMEDTVEDDEQADREVGANLTAKPRKGRLVCKECGKRFNRRETFNLHRHFHAHEDDLTPLTCKECGLTFQHRSSLIKHRNEHKEKEEQLVTPKKETRSKTEGLFKCAECEINFSTVDKLRDHNCCNIVEKPYHCPLCRQEFQFKVTITKHMTMHSQESTFKCQECSQTFPNSLALRYHQRCHTALKPYECPECGLVFKHYSVMEDHRRKHTDNARSHLCNICGKTFKYSSLLHQHQYLHTGTKPFRCPECGKKFAFAQNMKAHCRQHRRKAKFSKEEELVTQATASMQETVRRPGKENSQQSDKTKRTFNCPLCPQTCVEAADLRAHMLVHEAEYETLERAPRPPKENNKPSEKGHTCPHCPSVYSDESSLNMHLSSVHKSVAQHLEKVEQPPKILIAPLNSDNVQGKWKGDGINVKSYKCSECEKTFRHRSVLELHMRIHSKDKPYQCKVCGKAFRFGSYLQQHLIIHTGKKPYKCPDCGKDFAFLQNMKTHQRLHQEKPFRCTSCRKGYSDETQLQHHMLSHNGDKPHKCDLCDKSFGLAYLLRDHMNTHTGDRPHRCDECHKSFSWFSSLLVHQKIHVRKRQGLSQYNSLPVGARMRGRGSRGRRGGGLPWGWSRPLEGSGMDSSEQTLYPVSAPTDSALHRSEMQPQSSVLSPHVDVQSRQQQKEPHPPPTQWKVDGGEVLPVVSSQFDNLSHRQRSAGRADPPLITQSGPTSAQSSDSSHMKESTAAAVGSLVAPVPNKSSPSEMEQHQQPKLVTWSSTPTSTVLASTSSVQGFSIPASYIDGAALWSIRPSLLPNSQSSQNKPGQELQLPKWTVAPVSIQKEVPTPPKKDDGAVCDTSNPQVIPLTVSQPSSASASTSAQIDQSSAVPTSMPVSHGAGSTLWDKQTPPGIPKTINPEKLVNAQDLQQKTASPAWPTVTQAVTQKVPITIQYEPHRFGLGTAVWGFQSNQPLLSGQLKPGNGQELQQQPLVTGTQIIINQPSPFFTAPLTPLSPLALPGSRPIHSVAVGTLSRPPAPNIFFTPQAVMSERPQLTQTLPLPQLTPRTEPHKPGPRLPFAPERLLQCMICGCSLPRELDLQMHYLQHAQGEI